MRRRQKEFSLSTFVQKMLLAIFIIALIEIPVVYFYASYKHKVDMKEFDGRQANKVEKREQGKTVKTSSEAPPTIANDVMERPGALKVENLIAVNKTFIDSATKKPKTKDEKKPELAEATLNESIDSIKISKVADVESQLSEEKMAEILSILITEKEKLNIDSKCVKVRKTANSNVANGFEIVNYLKSNGFIISGREEVSKPSKGINVTAAGGCMVVTIGTL